MLLRPPEQHIALCFVFPELDGALRFGGRCADIGDRTVR